MLVTAPQTIVRRSPANLTAADAPIFNDGNFYSTKTSSLDHIGAASVSPDSVAYRRGQLLESTLASTEQRNYYRVRYLIKQTLAGKKVKLPVGKRYLLSTDAWSVGHYHWFTEVLPRLWSIRERTEEFVLMLPRTGYTESVGVKSFSALGISFAEIVWMETDALYKVPDLYHLTRIADPGQVDDSIMQQMNSAFVDGRPTGNRRVYVSRSKAPFRRVLNETELTDLLEAHDFEVVHAEDLTWDAQLDLFAETETLIGLHGAGLTNCLFMRPGGNVVELRKREPNYGYWHLASSVGHRYFYYNGIPDSDRTLIGRGCNLTIDISELEKLISAVE